MDITKIQNLKNQAISSILEARSEKELQNLRINLIGRRGQITEFIRQLPSLPLEKRKEIGGLINDVKKAIEQAIQNQSLTISHLPLVIDKEWIDVTVPGTKPPQGHLHLVTYAIREITQIFEKIGFIRVRYPEVDWDWYVFEGLNMPKNHPARDEWETFFIQDLKNKKYGGAVLTPHTSSGQLREMERVGQPPIRMLNIAKCYRRQYDVSHIPMFYQFEGLVVDKGINITHLKGVLDYFAKEFFGAKRKSRIRPHHFRFTEPSFEVDVSCGICEGRGCKLCKGGWLELGGAGMVHPQVLKNGGIDPKIYTGFAFGWGVERTYIMKSGLNIDDIRLLYNSDLRFSNQF
jgi:phenylalanyl-tRNA synthetase alpha chain